MKNQLKISFEGEVVRRWKEQSKTGTTLVYFAVKVPRGEWSDTFRIKAKSIDVIKPFEVGARVQVEAFVGGREWKNESTGKSCYFCDLNLANVIGVTETPPTQPETASDDVADDIPF